MYLNRKPCTKPSTQITYRNRKWKLKPWKQFLWTSSKVCNPMFFDIFANCLATLAFLFLNVHVPITFFFCYFDVFTEIHSSESGLNTSNRCFQITVTPQVHIFNSTIFLLGDHRSRYGRKLLKSYKAN